MLGCSEEHQGAEEVREGVVESEVREVIGEARTLTALEVIRGKSLLLLSVRWEPLEGSELGTTLI